jgi:hypothetical protein
MSTSPSASSSNPSSESPTTPGHEVLGASLSLGRSADGRPVSLDLGTGVIRETGAPDPKLRLLSAHDLDAARVLGVFRSAGYDVAVDEDGDLVVRDGRQVGVVIARPALLLVRMLMLYDFKEQVPTTRRRGCLAALNLRMHHGRFLIAPDGRLAATQELTTAAGLSAAQLLGTYRLFAEGVRESIEWSKVGRLLE